MVETLRARCDGWVRIVPDASGELHWKFRFTWGPWAGCYVYYKAAAWESAHAAWTGLERKLHLVDAGELKPTRDKFYQE